MSEQLILKVSQLNKVYEAADNRVHALKNVSFQLSKGECVAIMGTSGSGKSTLLNIIGAMDQPTSGEIEINNMKHYMNQFKEPHATLFRRENIGFVFQSFQLLKDLTVEENIALPLILKGLTADEVKQRVNEMIALVQLEPWSKHRPIELSGGQQQRVAIGRALITKPPIILADEPTGNLDFNTSTEILKSLFEMKIKLQQSILMVTHDAYVATYADRVLFFNDGEIVDEYRCQHSHQDMDTILHKFKVIMERNV
ncbi:ABC transporter ATP-binding protein [Lysinibacillus sp. fls2-241-R2A-57]|uniref:ABC transporter ATP-binding protein n=1 Tax=Lysinibacillus sp. fls2-241-R2A-57 TaxID=3040292 RepID=UPI002553B838|nr:ABC transporter ATP-binding protein [Lysinibacillus sp. fls2-241-R2A-57]